MHRISSEGKDVLGHIYIMLNSTYSKIFFAATVHGKLTEPVNGQLARQTGQIHLKKTDREVHFAFLRGHSFPKSLSTKRL